MSDKTGVLLCGHGSRDQRAVDEFGALAAQLGDRLGDYRTTHAFLEFATPIIADGLDELRQAGVRRVLAIPGMLFAAGHVKNDVPSALNAYAARHPDVDIVMGRELGLDLKLMRAAGSRVAAAIDQADRELGPVARHDTLLVTVGRGASDPDANGNIAKIMRMVWEGMGFGWGETAYSGITFPLVPPALERAARLGFRRIVVFPYFLFTGVLVERVYAQTDQAASRYPDLQFVKASYLADHPQVIETFIERVQEIGSGTNVMNCQLCKYRAQALGFEDEVGLAQRGHHHHVEGAGVGEVHADAAHHHHAHHPYPHADHPLGPRVLRRAASPNDD